MRKKITALLAAALLALTAPLLASCSSQAPSEGSNSPSAGASSATLKPGDEGAVVLTDGWAKAGESGGMTGVFGTLTNHSDQAVSIAGLGSSSPQAAMVEVHEVVDGKMGVIGEEIVLEPGESLELVPGGHHLMLMGLTQDLQAGEEVTIEFSYGQGGETREDIAYTATFTVLVKDYAGANEDYGDLEHDSHGAEGSNDAHGSHDAQGSHDAHGDHDGH